MKQRSLNLVPTTVLILEKTSILSFHFQSHGCLGSASCSFCLEMCYLLHNWTFQTFVPLPVWYMGFRLYPSKQGNDQPTQNEDFHDTVFFIYFTINFGLERKNIVLYFLSHVLESPTNCCAEYQLQLCSENGLFIMALFHLGCNVEIGLFRRLKIR